MPDFMGVELPQNITKFITKMFSDGLKTILMQSRTHAVLSDVTKRARGESCLTHLKLI